MDREQEREHISLLNINKKQGEREPHTSRIRAQPAAQLVTHPPTLAPAWLRISRASVLPFQGLLQTKLLEFGAKAYCEHSSIRLKAQEINPFTYKNCTASPHIVLAQLHSS